MTMKLIILIRRELTKFIYQIKKNKEIIDRLKKINLLNLWI
jgi:hypothetical protein